MSKPNSVRRRFVAALAVYLAWVGLLAAMAVTSSERPPARLIPPATDAAPPASPPAP